MTEYELMAEALAQTGIPFEEGGWDTAPEAPYGVYAPDGDGECLRGNDRLYEQVIQGTIDLYTRERGRELMLRIEAALKRCRIAWELNSIQYEHDTRLTHYEWTFEVIQDG